MELQFPVMRYDHTMPLLEGRIEIEGVTLKPTPTPAMIFDDNPALRTGDFGLCDLNVGYWLSAVEAGWQIIGLPLFIKRKPLYQYLFVRNDRGIEQPKDLEGKSIATGTYPTGITIQLQGLLQHRHGVDTSTLRWVANGVNKAFPVHTELPRIETASGEPRNPWARLLDGEVDALITDISDGNAWDALEHDAGVRRLFSDYVSQDKDLYESTGIYPVMHLIVMSKKLNHERPELAKQVYDAFEMAKELAYADTLNDRAGFSVVYLRERFVEQMRDWGDPWKYGVSANRAFIDQYVQFNFEQGITTRALSDSEIFASSTLDT